MNLIPGELTGSNGSARFVREGYELAIDPDVMQIEAGALSAASGPAMLGVRPEHLDLGSPESDGVPGVVRFLEPVGSDLFVSVEVGDESVQVRQPPRTTVNPGENVRLVFDPARAHIFGEDQMNLRMSAEPKPDVAVEPVGAED